MQSAKAALHDAVRTVGQLDGWTAGRLGSGDSDV